MSGYGTVAAAVSGGLLLGCGATLWLMSDYYANVWEVRNTAMAILAVGVVIAVACMIFAGGLLKPRYACPKCGRYLARPDYSLCPYCGKKFTQKYSRTT